jgi:hypothetical protein
MFMLLEITYFKAPDGRKNGKWIKMDLTRHLDPSFLMTELALRGGTKHCCLFLLFNKKCHLFLRDVLVRHH